MAATDADGRRVSPLSVIDCELVEAGLSADSEGGWGGGLLSGSVGGEERV